MSCFFFDLFDGKTTIEDKVGVDLTDVHAARERARLLAFSRDEPIELEDTPFDPRELRVRSADGGYVAKVAFRYVTA
jgi:hypothetical protein